MSIPAEELTQMRLMILDKLLEKAPLLMLDSCMGRDEDWAKHASGRRRFLDSVVEVQEEFIRAQLRART